MRAQFVFSEILIGLKRNLTMTIAVVVSVAVSLSLLGVALLIRQQANTMRTYYFANVDVIISFCVQQDPVRECPTGAATQQERDQVKAELDALKPDTVSSYEYVSQAEAYNEFITQFKGSALASSVNPTTLPDSYRVHLRDPSDDRETQVINSAFSGANGVFSVDDERKTVEPLFRLLNGIEWGSLWVAIVMFLFALMLIVNTVRLSAFSRRRETGIMRLVGASNFYIQLPFLLEGVVAGLVGGLLASGVIALFQ